MFLVLISLLGCKATEEPDGVWSVTVTGTETNCISDTSGYLESFNYALFFDGTQTEVYIEDDLFATGQLRGCYLEYRSAVYLEEALDGAFRWGISGTADVQGLGGGCDLPEDLDWSGTETLTVEESDNPNIEEGCTYTMAVEGTYSGS